MDFKMGQHVQTGQQLKLAPRIIQTMEIMQLPLPALEQKIQQELESNIALELADVDPVDHQDEDTTVSEEPSSEEYDKSEIDLSELPPRKAQQLDRDPKSAFAPMEFC